ncbi:coiled-coil domain containing 97-like [Planoprotostelium fungivorum]|uniref:Coiled-coil domain containing 97-like n=1 Tax=Planoprotostelium fungivorum TaxID=1890364 RepID=A0A2P6NS58_9EUKA|nr:coiled-coil domain containing 97-like [Planoprotostelium fungivorum]
MADSLLFQIAQDLSQNERLQFPSTKTINSDGELIESIPNLTQEEKRQKLLELVDRDIGLFFERYGKLLTNDHLATLSAYSPLKGNYEAQYYLKQLLPKEMSPLETSKHSEMRQQKKVRQTQNSRQNLPVLSRNRRFEYMNRLVQNGSYFSEEEMEARQPYIFHQYVGQYRKRDTKFKSEEKLYERLLRNYDVCDINERVEKDRERDAVIEEDSSSEEEKEMSEGDDGKEEASDDVDDPMSDEEQRQGGEQMEELLQIMKRYFLDGRDSAFVDYNKIDNDVSLDDIKQIGRDAEEEYFDEDE